MIKKIQIVEQIHIRQVTQQNSDFWPTVLESSVGHEEMLQKYVGGE